MEASQLSASLLRLTDIAVAVPLEAPSQNGNFIVAFKLLYGGLESLATGCGAGTLTCSGNHHGERNGLI